jgi:hypothetical protein
MTLQQDSTHPTGVSADENSERKAVVRARERKANAALQLRIAGADWEMIAEAIGYPTARHALIALESALEKEMREEGQSKEAMRAMSGKRLDRLLRSVWPKAINPEHPEHLIAMTKAREIVITHNKLFGLDAPTEMVVHSPDANELERWVATVVNTGRPQLEEADIFDIEEVDEDAAQVDES